MGWREEIGLAWHMHAEFGAHAVRKLVLRDRLAVHLWPFVERLEEDVGVGDVDAHRVRRDLSRADAGEGVGDVGEFLQEHLFGALLHVDGGIEADAGGADHVRGERSFVELRDELRAKPPEDEQGQRRTKRPRRRRKASAGAGRDEGLARKGV